MLFGHNTNIKLGELLFHVQTEDRGEAHGLIDTTVYFRGRVLHRRTNNYYDLFPLNEDSQQALRLRLDEQHRTVLDEMRSGALQLPLPPLDKRSPAAGTESTGKQRVAEHGPTIAAPKLTVELLNAKSWIVGKHATLHICVKREDGRTVSGALVEVEIEGSVQPRVYHLQTGTEGQAQVEFDMPQINGSDAALVIRAEAQEANGQLRFALRAGPRVPSV